MAGENLESTVLYEHRKVVTLRHILAIVNFIAILVGTLVTLHYVQIRGISNDIFVLLCIIAGINVVQIGLCIADYVLKFFFGRYYKWLVITSYSVGGAWFLATVLELVFSSVALGSLRIDLAAIAGIQGVTALIAYVIWPALDHIAIQQMTNPKIRDEYEKREKKAKAGVIRYALVCVLMVALQGGMLFAYKLPPKVYDIFAESRAVEYRLTTDGNGYEVVGVYTGTSDYVNIPAYYNNKPVVKILSGALKEDSILEANRIKTIEIGTPTTDENGNTVMESKLEVLEAGAIENNSIESIRIPLSVYKIEEGAIRSQSLKTVIYESRSDFSYSSFDCPSMDTITIEGEEAGSIVSLSGMPSSVTIKVAKEIYNLYREKNQQYASSLRPILPDDEFVVDFYTNADYYIESVFGKLGSELKLGYQDLKNDTYADTVAPSVDTLAYINDSHETGTAGMKENSAFRGWYYDKAFTQECRFTADGNVAFTSDTAIYAKWIDEYTGTLNWDTYIPDGQTRVLYWTDEDLVEFPVIEGRTGYQEGIKWYIGDSETQVTTSHEISESVTLNGKWQVDVPVIDIEPYALVSSDTSFVVATDKNTVSYIYDEGQTLCLDAVMSHALQGTSHNGKTFGFSTQWTKVNDANYSKADSTVKMNTVPESGEYVLTVTAKSPYGEQSFAQTNITVSIAKKALRMGTAELADYTGEYQPLAQTTGFVGVVEEERVTVTYKYYSETGEQISVNTGVKAVGNYTVKAFFEKSDVKEALNYETKELTANFTITPRPLEYVGWTASEYTYNATERSVEMQLSGVYSGDTVNVLYNDNKKTDAGEYEAEATGLDNPNYSIAAIDLAGYCRHSWEIKPKEVSVREWRLDGSNTSTFSIVYNGQEHTLQAVMDGVCADDVDSVQFVYDEMACDVKATDANTYTARIMGINSGNYFYTGASEQTWEITKKGLTVQFGVASDLVYDSQAKGLSARIVGVAERDFDSFTKEKFSYDDTSDNVTVGAFFRDDSGIGVNFTAVNAASYVAAINGIQDSADIACNYTLAANQSTFTIRPKDVYVINDGAYTYNGSNQTLTLKVAGITEEDLDGVSVEQFTTQNVADGASDGTYFNLTFFAKDAGAYPVAVTGFTNANYALSSFDGSVMIARKPLTATWKLQDLAQNETTEIYEAHTVTYNFSGFDAFVELSGVAGEETVEVSYTGDYQTGVGNYTTIATLPAEYTNYVMSDASIDWSITPYQVDFAWKFNGVEKDVTTMPTFTYSGGAVEIQPQYELLGTDELSISYKTGYADISKTDATSGLYAVQIASLGNGNYAIGDNFAFNWKIQPKTVTVTWSGDSQVTYNGEYRGPSFSVSGLLETGRTLKAQVGGQDVDFGVESVHASATYDFSTTERVIDAGQYTFNVNAVYKDGVRDGNYTVSGDNFSLIINQANVTLAGWTYSNATKGEGDFNAATKLVYNTQYYTLSSSIATGVYARNGVADDVYLTYGNHSYKDYSEDGYTAIAYLAGTHASNYTISGSNTLSWRIEQKPVTVRWISDNFIYNENTQYQRASVMSGATSDDDNKAYDTDSVWPVLENYAKVDAGTYTATLLWVDNENYCLAEEQQTKYVWTIAKLTVDAIWSTDSFTYNGYNQYPTAYYAYPGILGTITYEKEENSKDVKSNAYTISIAAITSPNFEISESTRSHSYMITPLTVSLSWGFGNSTTNAASYTYDGATRTIGAYVTNAKSGDTVNATITRTDAGASSSNLSIRNAGTYNYTVTGLSNGNYALPTNASAQKTITVSQRAATFAWGFDGATSGATSFTYDGEERTVSAYVSNAVDNGLVLSYNQADRTIRNAGTYTFAVTAINNSNYYVPAYNYQTSITIGQKQLSFFLGNSDGNAMSDSWVYGAYATQQFVTVYTSDTIFGDDVSLSYTTSANSDYVYNAGTYRFTVTGITGDDAGNYTLPSTRVKTITVSPQPVSVTWSGSGTITYDGETHLLTAIVRGKNDGKIISNGTAWYYSGSNTFINAGTHSVSVVTSSSGNYTTTDGLNVSASLTINRAEATVTWNVSNHERYTYDGTTHTLTATVSGVNGENVVGTYSGGRTISNVGSLTTSITVNTGNYTTPTDGSASVTVHVDPCAVTVAWGTDTYTYNGYTHYLTATVSGVGGENVSFNYANGNSLVNAGEKLVSIASLNNTNYTLENANGDVSKILTVEKAKLKVVWTLDGVTQVDSTNWVATEYNGAMHYFTIALARENGSIVNDIYSVYVEGSNNYQYAGVYTVSVAQSGVLENYELDSTTTSITFEITETPTQE